MSKNAQLIFFLLILSFPKVHIFGQLGKNIEKSIPFKSDLTFSFLIHNGGYGVSGVYGRKSTDRLWNYFSAQINTLKHPKEISVTNQTQQESGTYIFGKMNYVTSIQLSYGLKYVIAQRLDKNSVKLNLNLAAGPTLALIKPIYYDVDYGKNSNGILSEKFDPNNDNQNNSIVGTSPFSKGLSEMSGILGANAKTSLSVEWGTNDYRYLQLECGAFLNGFVRELPIFAFVNNKSTFFSPFISIGYGFRRD